LHAICHIAMTVPSVIGVGFWDRAAADSSLGLSGLSCITQR
jgi:hypothetical protein